jgi:hypothetical protein
MQEIIAPWALMPCWAPFILQQETIITLYLDASTVPTKYAGRPKSALHRAAQKVPMPNMLTDSTSLSYRTPLSCSKCSIMDALSMLGFLNKRCAIYHNHTSFQQHLGALMTIIMCMNVVKNSSSHVLLPMSDLRI